MRFYRTATLLGVVGCMLSVGCMRTAALHSARPDSPGAARDLSPRSDPDAVLVRLNKGVRLLENGESKQARLLFEKLRDDYPRISIFHVNLGVTYKRLGLLPDAITSYQRALELERGNAEVYYDLAIALREQGEFLKAEQAYKTALTLSPGFRDAHYNLAVLYDLYLDEPEEAVQHYRRFLDLGGGDPEEIEIWITALQKRMDESGRVH